VILFYIWRESRREGIEKRQWIKKVGGVRKRSREYKL
jgi:hypothetical protein